MKGLLAFIACAILLIGQPASGDHISSSVGTVETINVNLHLRWQLGGENQIIGQITDVFEDAHGDICLLDAQLNELLVYSPTGEFRRLIGREGEGPGEFHNPSGAFNTPGGYAVMQSLPVKLVLYDRSGAPKSNIFPVLESLESPKSMANCSDGTVWNNDFLLACIFFRMKANEQYVQEELSLFDSAGRKLRTLFSKSNPADFTLINELEDNYYTHRFVTDGSRLYVVPFFEKYEIHVFDQRNNSVRIITREHPALERTPEEKKRISYSLSRGLPYPDDMNFKIMDHHRAIEQINIGPDGQILLSGEGAWRTPDGVLGIFDIYSRDDLFLVRRVQLLANDSFLTDYVWIIGNNVIVIKCARDLLLGPHDEQDPCINRINTQVICYGMDN